MSTSAILTHGIGSFGSSSHVLTQGLGFGAATVNSQRFDIIGTSQQRLSLAGTSQQRLTLTGSSG